MTGGATLSNGGSDDDVVAGIALYALSARSALAARAGPCNSMQARAFCSAQYDCYRGGGQKKGK